MNHIAKNKESEFFRKIDETTFKSGSVVIDDKNSTNQSIKHTSSDDETVSVSVDDEATCSNGELELLVALESPVSDVVEENEAEEDGFDGEDYKDNGDNVDEEEKGREKRKDGSYKRPQFKILARLNAIDAKIAEAKERGVVLLPETVIYSCIRGLPPMIGACADWPDIKNICFNAIRELKSSLSYVDNYSLVLDVVVFYDTKIISVERSIPSRKRLAYFISALVNAMMDCREYMAEFIRKIDGRCEFKKTVLRGLIIKRIATPEAMAICGRYFQNEVLAAELFEQQLAEEKRLSNIAFIESA